MQNIDFIKQPWLKLERLILHLCYLAIRKNVKSNPYPKHIKKILLIRRNRLGDSINILPIIESLKKNYPSVKISVLANKYNAEIFNYSEYIDQVYCINEKWGLGRITLYFNPVIKKLRLEGFDLIIGLGGFASMLSQIAFCIKGKYSVGPKSLEGNFNDLLFDFVVEKIKGKNTLHVDEMANIVKSARLKLPKKLDSKFIFNLIKFVLRSLGRSSSAFHPERSLFSIVLQHQWTIPKSHHLASRDLNRLPSFRIPSWPGTLVENGKYPEP